MELLQPEDWPEALEARAAHPGALPLWGGTDVMVDLNFGRERPEVILDLTRVRELAEWEERDGRLRVGAGVSYTRAIAELGDRLPPLYASGAEVELASARGTRRLPIGEFITGPKRNVLEPDELIAAFHVAPAAGPQQFSKVGTRNAMVIAVCSFALAIHPHERRVGTCIGSAGPTPLVADDAEAFAAGMLDW